MAASRDGWLFNCLRSVNNISSAELISFGDIPSKTLPVHPSNQTGAATSKPYQPTTHPTKLSLQLVWLLSCSQVRAFRTQAIKFVLSQKWALISCQFPLGAHSIGVPCKACSQIWNLKYMFIASGPSICYDSVRQISLTKSRLKLMC